MSAEPLLWMSSSINTVESVKITRRHSSASSATCGGSIASTA